MASKCLLVAIVLTLGLAEKGGAVNLKRQNITVRVRTSVYDLEPKPSYLHIPDSIDGRDIDKYEKVSLEKHFSYPLELYCLCKDPRFCIFFDREGRIAGVQISYPTRDLPDINPKIYNMSNLNFVDTNFFDIPTKSVRIYLTNPDQLTAHGRPKTSHKLIEGLWTRLDGEMVRFDKMRQPNSPLIGDFFMLGCAPKIGQFYTRNIDGDSCQNGSFLSLLYEKGKLVGFGHAMPGMIPSGPLNLFNYPNGKILKTVVPDPPPCFLNLAPHGITSMIIWIIEDPWNIQCPTCFCDQNPL